MTDIGIIKQKANRLFREASLLRKKGHLNAAISLMEDVASLSEELPPSASSLYLAVLGEFYEEAGRSDDGVECANRALEIHPKNFHAMNLLGKIRSAEGYYEEAAKYYRKSVALKPDYAVYTLLSAVEYEFDLARAAEHAQEALRLNPDWREARVVLDKVQAKANAG